jgi:hypothetical protein
VKCLCNKDPLGVYRGGVPSASRPVTWVRMYVCWSHKPIGESSKGQRSRDTRPETGPVDNLPFLNLVDPHSFPTRSPRFLNLEPHAPPFLYLHHQPIYLSTTPSHSPSKADFISPPSIPSPDLFTFTSCLSPSHPSEHSLYRPEMEANEWDSILQFVADGLAQDATPSADKPPSSVVRPPLSRSVSTTQMPTPPVRDPLSWLCKLFARPPLPRFRPPSMGRQQKRESK